MILSEAARQAIASSSTAIALATCLLPGAALLCLTSIADQRGAGMARISHRSNTIHTKVTIILCEVLLYTRCVTPLGRELLLYTEVRTASSPTAACSSVDMPPSTSVARRYGCNDTELPRRSKSRQAGAGLLSACQEVQGSSPLSLLRKYRPCMRASSVSTGAQPNNMCNLGYVLC